MNLVIKSIAFVLAVSVLLSGCVTSGAGSHARFTPLTSTPCEQRPESVALFFEGELYPSAYEKVGLVESKGANHASDQEVIDRLKYQAWMHCANAIILVKKSYTQRHDLDANEIYPDPATVYSGVAVRIAEKDTATYELDFVQRVQDQQVRDHKQAQAEIGFIVFLAAATTVLCVIFLKNQADDIN